MEEYVRLFNFTSARNGESPPANDCRAPLDRRM